MADKRQLGAQNLIRAAAIGFLLILSINGSRARAGATAQAETPTIAPVITDIEIDGKVLTVIGANFSSGAKVLLNGEPQKTRFDSPTQLTAKKSGKRLHPGDNLQVRNPDGTTSPELLYYKEPYEISVMANDMAYSPVTDRLYVSVNSQAAQYANSIAIVNARTAQVETTIAVGRQPSKLAFSDDYRFIYVVVEDGLKAQRVNLGTSRVDLQVDLKTAFGVEGCAFAGTDLRVMPGHPETIAVALECNQYTIGAVVAIFDNGVRRPAIVTGIFTGSALCFGATADTLWGYEESSTNVSQYQIDAQGVHLVDKPFEGLLSYARQRLVLHNGLVYATNGRVVRPEQRTFDGRFFTQEAFGANASALDTNTGRAYFGQRDGYDFAIAEFDIRTYRLTRYYKAYYGLVSELGQMVSCGSAGLALLVPPLLTTGRIVIFPLSLMKPGPTYEPPPPVPITGGVRRIPLPNYEIAYDASRQRFYASVPSVFAKYGNSIVPIDPIAGTVGEPVWAGSEPWQMAVTDDGQYLYTVLFGGRAIQRLRLPDLGLDLRYPLFNDGALFQGPMSTTAAEILTVPGHPESLVVARWGDHNHDPFDSDGVAVYDNGVKRPASTPNWTNGSPRINTIQLSAAANTLYGLTTDSSDHTFTRMGLDSSGAHITASREFVGDENVSKMRCQGGLCFTNTGLIIDPETQTRLGRFRFDLSPLHIGGTNLVLPDVAHNRVYFIVALDSNSGGGVYVLAYDLSTRMEVASYRALDGLKNIVSFWAWGNDQFAFSTGEEVVFFPKSLLQPSAPSASAPH